MTVALQDANDKMQRTHPKHTRKTLVQELAYADDTLLIHTDVRTIEAYMACVGEAGSEYGLTFNGKKLEALPARTAAHIHNPDQHHMHRSVRKAQIAKQRRSCALNAF